MLLSSDHVNEVVERLRIKRLRVIVQTTLGFGLGIAWNVLLSQFAPEDRSSWDVVHVIGLAGYLAVVALIAFRLAAVAPDSPETLWDRQLSLMAFAFYVVCAFTLVILVNALFAPRWLGALESLALLLILSAIMSAMVAHVDLNRLSEREDEQKFSLSQCPFILILLVPCVWFCCPWIPLLWLLAGTTENVGVKEHWFRLIAMVSGLASSIEASRMLTLATDELAGSLGICNSKHCSHKWLFVLLQVILAVIVTAVLIPAIAPLAPENSSNDDQAVSDDRVERGESQSLLRRVSGRFRRGRGSK